MLFSSIFLVEVVTLSPFFQYISSSKYYLNHLVYNQPGKKRPIASAIPAKGNQALLS